jgi:hypothetical protein
LTEDGAGDGTTLSTVGAMEVGALTWVSDVGMLEVFGSIGDGLVKGSVKELVGEPSTLDCPALFNILQPLNSIPTKRNNISFFSMVDSFNFYTRTGLPEIEHKCGYDFK